MTQNEIVKIEDDDAPDYGPLMMALPNDRERNYIVGVLQGLTGAAAAKAAGFGNSEGTTSAESYARIAHRLNSRQRIAAAMQEQIAATIKSLGPAAVNAARQLLTNTTHKDHGRAVFAVIDKILPTETRSNVVVTHKTEDIEGIYFYYQKLLALGLDRARILAELGIGYLTKCEAMAAEGGKLPIIDASFEVLDPVSEEQQLSVEDL